MNRSVTGLIVIVMGFIFAPALCMLDPLHKSDDWKYHLIADISAGASQKVLSSLTKLSLSGKQADIKTIVTDQGKTLLMLAAQKSLYEVAVKILACISPEDRITYLNQKDAQGHTMEYYAQLGEHGALVELLKYYVSVHKNDTLLDITVAHFAAAMDKVPLDTLEEKTEEPDSEV
ncbi:MAG: hypothetical protein WC365_03125 [Candidatus Babeliales bacterium]|jgi:hypothetical protein